MTKIGEKPFEDCYELTAINVKEGNENYSSYNGVLFNKDKTELICCPIGKIETYVIPDGVKTIGSYAFKDCSNLWSVIIPDTVEVIGDYAFNL